MATLKPLDPAPSVSLGEVQFTATEAGRTEKGLTASVQVMNGTGIFLDRVAIVSQADRARFAERVADCTGQPVPEIEAKLLELSCMVDVLLRRKDQAPKEENPKEKLLSLEEVDEDFGELGDWRSVDCEYVIRNSQTYHLAPGNHPVKIANFSAWITEETVIDTGAEVKRFFTVEGTLHTGADLPPVRIPVARFHSMNWVSSEWGFGPRIIPGSSAKGHLRAAIEEFSGPRVPRKTVFGHLGWRKIDKFVYLHADGSVGADNVLVDLDSDLQHYKLPRTSDDEQVLEAMAASLRFLQLGDPKIVFPIWSLIWRVPLCEWIPFLLVPWLLGPTGTYKSTLSALALSHFGGPFDKDNLPASWIDTENRLELRTFLAKDVLLVVDDFTPEKHAGLAQELERRASRLIRTIGNRQARGRLGSDLKARPTYYPRGIVISTAEQLPNVGHSALARILPIPFEEGAIDKVRLTALQGQAKLLPHALCGYVQDLAHRDGEFWAGLRTYVDYLRDQAQVDGHARLPETVAHIYLGFEMGLHFAQRIGALDSAKVEALCQEGWQVFMALARAHARTLTDERPTKVFLETLEEALSLGEAHLADRTTGVVVIGKPGTPLLGWVDEDHVYLVPGAAYGFVAQRVRPHGRFPLNRKALTTMMAADGVIQRAEKDRHTFQVRISGHKNKVRVWCLGSADLGLPGISAGATWPE